MNILIREARQEDMHALFPLWKMQIEFHYELDPLYYVPVAPDEEKQFEKYFTESLSSQDPQFLVAEVDGMVVGFISFKKGQASYIDSNVKEYGFILELFVKAEYREHGVGNKLMEEAENHVRSEGITYMKLEAATHNEKASTFYEDRGYQSAINVMYKKIL